MLLFLSFAHSAKDSEQLSELYYTYRQTMWYVAKGILQDEHLAEDAVQEAFITLTRHLDKVGPTLSPRTRNFLITIVRTRALDLLRQKNRQPDSLDTIELFNQDSGQRDILEQLIVKDNIQHLKRVLSSMSLSDRTLLEYKYMHQLKESEIADILGLPPKTVNMRIYRARHKLMVLLQKEDFG